MRKYWLEFMWIVTVILLIGQIAWPTAFRWWHRPGPGMIGRNTFESNSALADRYAIYLPVTYDERVEPWPLVVFLHGSGHRGQDPTVLYGSGPLALVQEGAELPAIIAAPQCLPNSSWDPEAIVHFVAHVAATYRVDNNRIYLIGCSMGGYGTWAVAAAYPEEFAAIVPICGGSDTDRVDALADIPTWAFHGANDNIVPLAQSERVINAIRAAGGQPRLTVIPEAQHDICDTVCHLDELWKWLLRL